MYVFVMPKIFAFDEQPRNRLHPSKRKKDIKTTYVVTRCYSGSVLKQTILWRKEQLTMK